MVSQGHSASESGRKGWKSPKSRCGHPVNLGERVAGWGFLMSVPALAKPLAAAALRLMVASCVTSNDTGGMIPYSPQIEPIRVVAQGIADEHCARYGRYAVITSVHPWPGDYVGFVCRIPNRWGPRLR